MGMSSAKLEIVIFDAAGFTFGAEVSHITSIVRSSEIMEQMDETVSLVDLSMQSRIGKKTPSNVLSAKISTDHDDTLVLLVKTPIGTMGVYVESVRGTVAIPLKHIEPLPEYLKHTMQTDCIWGIGKLQQDLIILLDLDSYVRYIRLIGS